MKRYVNAAKQALSLFHRYASKSFSEYEVRAWQNFYTEIHLSKMHEKGLAVMRERHLTAPRRLNLGCGTLLKEGFVNVDLVDGADLMLDLRRGLPFETATCDLIFSEHCFEHIDYPEPISRLFKDCRRVLRDTGKLTFSIPDTVWPLRDYHQGPDAPFFKAAEEWGWHPGGWTTRMEHVNYHFRQKGEHRFCYDLETITKLLHNCGFSNVRQREYDPSIDSAIREVGSLFIEAIP